MSYDDVENVDLDYAEYVDGDGDEFVLKPISEGDKSKADNSRADNSRAEKSGLHSAKDSPTVHMNSTAQGSQQLFDPGNMSSINASDGSQRSQRSERQTDQTDASQDSQSAVKTNPLMRDFVTEDMSEWKKIKSFPLKFQAEILDGKIQISGKQGESILYTQRNRITVVKREGLVDNSRNTIQRKKTTEKEKKKHSREGREATFTFQEGMTYCLTDIPETRIPMIFNEKYLGDSMEKLYRHHQKTHGINWDDTHNKLDYMKNIILEELKETYRFLEIMQRPESDPSTYTSSGN